MLKQRIITALILIPLTLLFLYYASSTVFGIVTAVMVLAAAWEWSNFFDNVEKWQRVLYVIFILVFLQISLFVPIYPILMIAALWWLFALILIASYPRSRNWTKRFFRLTAGILVLVPCWLALNDIHYQSDGFYTLLFLFVLIWGADSAAYFVGRAFGKHKLAPEVSPGKTVEGVIGALIFAILFALLAARLSGFPPHVWHLGVILAVLTVIFSIVGDLFESMLKREVGIKDSGKLFPGHGGLLDRIDSLTAAAPIFLLGAMLLGKYLEQ